MANNNFKVFGVLKAVLEGNEKTTLYTEGLPPGQTAKSDDVTTPLKETSLVTVSLLEWVKGNTSGDFNTPSNNEGSVTTFINKVTGALTSKVQSLIDNKTYSFSSLTGKPTTIEGYQITDSYTKSEVFNKTEVSSMVNAKQDIITKTASDKYINGLLEPVTFPPIPTMVSQLTNDSGYTTNTGTVRSINTNNANNSHIELVITDPTGNPTLKLTNTSPNATHAGDVVGSQNLTIVNNVVTNAKLANIPTKRIKGRYSSNPGVVEDLTPTQVKDILELNLVENKSSSTILSELTKEMVVRALKYTPYNESNPSLYVTKQYIEGERFSKAIFDRSGTTLTIRR